MANKFYDITFTPGCTMEEIKLMIQPLNEHIQKLEKEIEKLKAEKV